MKSTIVKMISTLFLSSIFSQAFANLDSISIGEPIYGGNGCPKGSADVFLSSDQNSVDSLEIRFNKFITEAGGKNASIDRKSCNLAIPLHVPNGYSVSVLKIDYRGFLQLPRKAQAQFDTEYFFAGDQGVKHSKLATGKKVGDFSLVDNIALESTVWSKCGEDTILRVNSSLLLKTNKKNEEAVAIIDTTHIDSGVIYQLNIKKCSI